MKIRDTKRPRFLECCMLQNVSLLFDLTQIKLNVDFP